MYEIIHRNRSISLFISVGIISILYKIWSCACTSFLLLADNVIGYTGCWLYAMFVVALVENTRRAFAGDIVRVCEIIKQRESTKTETTKRTRT